MKTLFKYAIVRFMPFAETQEFANVGVVVWSKKLEWIGYKLASHNFPRVNRFFDDLDGRLYNKALHYTEEELQRVISYCQQEGSGVIESVMSETTRPREGVMTYSETGALLTETPELTLNQLYKTYIGRDFPIQREQRERTMVQELRSRLDNLPLHYKERALDTSFGQVRVPLVTQVGDKFRAIKPLSFNQPKPLEIVDHGDKWVSRIRHLLDAKSIEASDFLFAVEPPNSQKEENQRAYEAIENNMRAIGVKVTLFKDKKQIINFADLNLDNSVDDFALI